MTALDWGLVAALCAVLFATSAYHSRGRLLWADELLCHQIFADPSFLHRLYAWNKGADGGGLLYYLLGSLWFRLFPLSELSLRLFSTAGMSVALALLWTALRRYASLCATAISLGIIFFTPPAMLWQELNGRFYGLFLASTCLAALLFLLVAESSRPSRPLLLALFLAHAGLVTSHIFGVIFSLGLVLGTWGVDRIRHRTRWSVYLIPLSAWLLVLLSLPSIRASTSIVGKFFWTRRPTVNDLLFSFAGYGRATALLLGGLLAAAFLVLLWSRLFRSDSKRTPPVPLAPAALVGSLVVAACLFFAKSQVGPSIFSDRYLLPLLIATAFVLAGALSLLLPRALTRPRTPALALGFSSLVLLPCCLFGATRQVNFLLYPTAAYVQHVNAHLRPGVPAVAGLPVFPFLQTYDPHHEFLFLTDWSYDDDPRHLADYSGEHLMENWKRAGYDSEDILSCSEIFTRYPHVDLLVGPHRAAWLNDQVLHDPHLQVTPVAVVHEWDWVDIWTVDRVSPGPPPC